MHFAASPRLRGSNRYGPHFSHPADACRSRACRGADYSASGDAAAAEAFGVSGTAVSAAAKFVESAEVEIAAFDFAGPALRGHRFFGLGLGTPQFAGHRLVGRSGSARSPRPSCSTLRRECSIGIKIKPAWKWRRKWPSACSRNCRGKAMWRCSIRARCEAAFSVDAAVAKQKIVRLGITAAAQPLPELCSQALRLVSESNRGRKEVYVFTDLGRQAWSAEVAARLREKLADKTDIGLYIVDVGVEDPKDISLGDLRPSAESLAKNSPLTVQTELAADGAMGDDRSVAIYTVDPATGELQLRSQSSTKATPEQPQPVDFQLDGLDLGIHQGVVRIAGEDSLPADDSRYFTVDVRPPWKVLVVAPKPIERRASLLTEPISPTPFRRTGQARFECDVIGFDDLAGKSLDDYAAVCLLDPPRLADAVWQLLAGFAERGGGVSIWLGRNAQPQGHSVDEFNTAAAQAIMPGKLARIWHHQDAFLAPGDYQHPMLAKFRSVTGGVPWEEFTVDSHWQLADFNAGVNPVMSYSNGQPAILEKSLGKGRVLVFTTPISDEATARRFVEYAGGGQRTLALFHASKRSDAVPGRQRRRSTEFLGRRNRDGAFAGERTAVDFFAPHARGGRISAIDRSENRHDHNYHDQLSRQLSASRRRNAGRRAAWIQRERAGREYRFETTFARRINGLTGRRQIPTCRAAATKSNAT